VDIAHYLGCIKACQELIVALEAKAVEFPQMANDIGDTVAAQKAEIVYYREKIRALAT
jgi:hypothetical protein